MIHVIIGAPCAGKSTFVKENAKDGDVIVDFDLIAKALGAKEHLPTGHIKSASFKAREAVIDYILKSDCEAWIIHTSPNEQQMKSYEEAGAEIVSIDTDFETCMERAQDRPEGTEQIIRDYFGKAGNMLVKEFNLQVKSTGEGGYIEAYAATFDREPDSYGDVIAKGAFTNTLKKWEESGKPIPLLFGHNMSDPEYNIGTVVSAVEDEKGLLIRAEYDMDNPKAQYVRKLVNEGRVWKMSFAYDVLDYGEVELENGFKACELRELDIYECSIVTVPANNNAVILDSKSKDNFAELAERVKQLEAFKEAFEQGKEDLEANAKAEEQKNLNAKANELLEYIGNIEREI